MIHRVVATLKTKACSNAELQAAAHSRALCRLP